MPPSSKFPNIDSPDDSNCFLPLLKEGDLRYTAQLSVTQQRQTNFGLASSNHDLTVTASFEQSIQGIPSCHHFDTKLGKVMAEHLRGELNQYLHQH